MIKNKMCCPMCDTELSWNPTNLVYQSNEETTHIYTCPECPFVGFEFYSKRNTDDLSKYLKVETTAQQLKSTLDYLLDVAEEHLPNYSSNDNIMQINDLYKQIYG